MIYCWPPAPTATKFLRGIVTGTASTIISSTSWRNAGSIGIEYECECEFMLELEREGYEETEGETKAGRRA